MFVFNTKGKWEDTDYYVVKLLILFCVILVIKLLVLSRINPTVIYHIVPSWEENLPFYMRVR